MSSNTSFKTRWNDASEANVAYSRLSVSALLSAFFGMGTFLVYFTPGFFFLGVIAVLLSLYALWTIRNSEGILTGTSLAYIGLCSAVIALVSVAVFWAAYQYGIRREADQFYRLWFAAVQQGDIPKAKDFQIIYANRPQMANAEEWWKKQYEEKYSHRAVHQYVENKLIRVLMALGDKATVSYYKTLSVNSERESDTVVSVYAVTFPAESGTETFFVRVKGCRSFPSTSSDFNDAGWSIEDTPEFYLPEELKNKP